MSEPADNGLTAASDHPFRTHSAAAPPAPIGRAVLRDRSFLGMTITQFMGVFNDNLFKQIVLFLCIDLSLGRDEQGLQGAATIAFSLPFILLSGYCGYLSDRYSKRSIIVLSKTLEIVVMLLGMAAFYLGNITVLMSVVFLMGAQSALFGPSKYGVLPELFHEDDLPRVNGLFQMTMFVAIILGFASSGIVKTWAGEQLWKAGLVCIAIAAGGTLVSLLIRQTPIAHPGLKFQKQNLIVHRETRLAIWHDRRLLLAMLATSAFWATGGLVYPLAINDLGRLQLGLDDIQTGFLAAGTGLGIAVGCVVGMAFSRDRFNARLVVWGTRGMFVTLLLLSWPGSPSQSNLLGVWGSAAALVALGLFAGLFNVPLQAYIQAKAPAEHKGRVIGAMNLANWIGIYLSGAFYKVLAPWLAEWGTPRYVLFAISAGILLPLMLLYRPRSERLSENPPAAR